MTLDRKWDRVNYFDNTLRVTCLVVFLSLNLPSHHHHPYSLITLGLAMTFYGTLHTTRPPISYGHDF